MHVIHVTPTPFGFEGIHGGGERYPHELARAMARLVSCELVTFGPTDATVRDESGLSIRMLKTNRYLHGHPAHPVSAGIFGALNKADVTHVHQMRSVPGKMAAVAAKMLRRHSVVTDHGMYGSDWGGFLQQFFDAFLLVSSFSARMAKAPANKTTIIHGGVDQERFTPRSQEERNGVLFVGRITPHKGIDYLIKALPSGARLFIVGMEGLDPDPPESDYPNYLRQLASGKDVHFLGRLSDTELPTLYRQVKMLVLPSVERTCYGREVAVSELLGLVVLEAMASGTPVICSRIGGIPEIVDDSITGFLVEPGNVVELRERISSLLSDSRKVRSMGNAAREIVCDRFTWQSCAERCLSVYERISKNQAVVP